MTHSKKQCILILPTLHSCAMSWFLDDWSDSKLSRLTKHDLPTFLACRITFSDLADLTEHLPQWGEFNFDIICIIYYVAGCIGRSISGCNRCGSCKEALVLDRGIEIEDVSKIKDECDKLLKLADCWTCCTYQTLYVSVQYDIFYCQIQQKDLMGKFLQTSTIQHVFFFPRY